MAMLDLNLEGYEVQNTSFGLIPEGQYICQITDSEVGVSKAGRPKLTITFTLADGEYAGRKLWTNFTLDSEMGLKIFKSLCVASGHPNPNFVRDSDELHGLYVKARVVISKQDGYADKNDVKGFSSAGGESSAASAPKAPAAPAAAKPAAKKPWERTAA